MAIALGNNEIESVGTMRLCMDAMAEIYQQIADGTAGHSPRIDVLTPRPEVEIHGHKVPSYHLLKTMSAATPKYACVRFLTDLLAWSTVGGAVRKTWVHPTRKDSVTRGLLLLFEIQSGDLLAILAEGWIRNMRVGASAGLAAQQLANRNVRRIGLIGSGFMARANLEAINLARPGCTVRIFSPARERREQFAAKVSARLELDIIPVESAQAAVTGADLVIAATNSLKPVMEAAWLSPGMHLTNVRHCEFDGATYRACQRVFLNLKTHARPQAVILGRQDGLPTPDVVRSDVEFGHPSDEDPFVKRLPDLVDLLRGQAPGRGHDDEITCFDNSIGWGLQFAAVAGRVYELAVSQGLGTEIPNSLLPGLFD